MDYDILELLDESCLDYMMEEVIQENVISDAVNTFKQMNKNAKLEKEKQLEINRKILKINSTCSKPVTVKTYMAVLIPTILATTLVTFVTKNPLCSFAVANLVSNAVANRVLVDRKQWPKVVEQCKKLVKSLEKELNSGKLSEQEKKVVTKSIAKLNKDIVRIENYIEKEKAKEEKKNNK